MPRRGENIYKRSDGRWEARYIKQRSPEGKAIYGYLYARSYRDVKAKLQNQQRHEEALFADTKTNHLLFQTTAEEWLVFLAPQIKAATMNKYRNLLETYIYPRMGSMELNQITHSFLEMQCKALLQSGRKDGGGLAPKTVSDILSVIRNVLKFAIKTGVSVSCDGQSIRIKQSAGEMRILSRLEQEQLCRYLLSAPDGCNLGILVSLFTGIRLGEICALQWEDISTTEKTIHVRHTMQRIQDREGKTRTKVILTTPKSAYSVRVIPIPDALMQTMLSITTERKGYFLTGSMQCYIEPRTMQNHFKKALKASGIADVNYHALRHTFATRCIEAGFDVKSLSEILGHASVNITMNRYVHPSMDMKKENMERLSALFAVK